MTTLSSIVSPNSAAFYSVVLLQIPTIVIMIIGLILIAKKGRRPMLLIGQAITIIGTACVAATGLISSSFLAITGRLGKYVFLILQKDLFTYSTSNIFYSGLIHTQAHW